MHRPAHQASFEDIDHADILSHHTALAEIINILQELEKYCWICKVSKTLCARCLDYIKYANRQLEYLINLYDV